MARSAEPPSPLKPIWFHVLLAIASGARHGYAIRKDVNSRTEGRVTLWPTTLYGTIAHLVDAGLIAESAEQDADDDRRRLYDMTGLGRRVLAAEADRMDALVRAVRQIQARLPSVG